MTSKDLEESAMQKIAHCMISISGATVLMLMSFQAAAATTLNVGTWLSPRHTMNADVLATWGTWIEEATQGRVKVKLEFSGGHPRALLDEVQDGVYDATWNFHGYFPGRFKLTQLIELHNLSVSAEAASIAYWRVHEKYLSKANEHKGVVLAGLFTHAPGQIHLRKPITDLSEMKNKRIRIGGGIQAKIANKMGIEGVAVPGSKVYEMLSQGVADGVFMTMGEKRSLRLKEVAPFTLKFPKGMYLGSFGIFLNQQFIDSLSEQDRQAIMSVSGEKLSAMAGKYWELDADRGEKDAIESGNQILNANQKMITEFNAMATEIENDLLQSLSGIGVDVKAALKELREIAGSY